MPVDYTGVLIALVVWIGGTIWVYNRIRTGMLARHDPSIDGPLPAVRPIFWTMWVSIGLAVVCCFVTWFFVWIRGLA
jgi:hypothetical protein